ncbi:MAG: permease, partial [Pseudomonadota bacterium]
AQAAWQQSWSSTAELMLMRWFRRYVMISIALQTVELSVPFFAILAAISQGGSQKGLTALILSSAAALVVSGPIWRLVGRRSDGAVMAGGALMAAMAGILLIINYIRPILDVTLIHAAALFAVTVAMTGVSNARTLYFMDLAPKDYRIAGLAASKSVVRIVGIFLATGVAALAHLQHITWAIALVAGLNLLTAVYVFIAAAPPAPATGKA